MLQSILNYKKLFFLFTHAPTWIQTHLLICLVPMQALKKDRQFRVDWGPDQEYSLMSSTITKYTVACDVRTHNSIITPVH